MGLYLGTYGSQGSPAYLVMKIATGIGATGVANYDGLVEIVAEVTIPMIVPGQVSTQLIHLYKPMTLHVDYTTLAKTFTPWFLGNSGSPYIGAQTVVTQVNSDYVVGVTTADTDTVTKYLAQRGLS
jgi:hypothetical protein